MSMLVGGETLDTPELVAIAIAQAGPEHVRTCTNCNDLFFSAKLAGNTCRECWYKDQIAITTNSFKPLSDELEKLLEVKTVVDQTGGMVMCLRVPIGRVTGDYGETSRWAWFSELMDCVPDLGFGLYDARGLDEDMPEGEYQYWPEQFTCYSAPCCWYHHPETALAVAQWAAPLIVEFATREEFL